MQALRNVIFGSDVKDGPIAPFLCTALSTAFLGYVLGYVLRLVLSSVHNEPAVAAFTGMAISFLVWGLLYWVFGRRPLTAAIAGIGAAIVFEGLYSGQLSTGVRLGETAGGFFLVLRFHAVVVRKPFRWQR
jgi:hypothetical protein